MEKIKKNKVFIIILSTYFIVALGVIGFFVYQNILLKQRVSFLEQSLYDKETMLALTEQNLGETSTALEASEKNLSEEKNKVGELSEKVTTITGTIGVLERLSNTDEELLQKYSKIYFLNEHYSPEIAVIDPKYTLKEDVEYGIHKDILPYLESLMKEAYSTNMELLILSAFRSFGEQGILKSSYNVVYGEGTANQFSADQGYSEHQLGSTVDFTTKENGGELGFFKTTDEYVWLKNNAHRFGFVLSYPEKNGYYIFEPWHWRFVGIELATKLYEDNRHFYDLDQSLLDTYLISIFDSTPI